MVDERNADVHTFVERLPTPAEIARDIVIAAIGRSAEYNPGVVNTGKARNQIELIAHAYEVILKKVREEGIE